MPTEEILTGLMESGHESTNDAIAASCANKFKRIGPHVIKVETEIEAMKLAMEFEGV